MDDVDALILKLREAVEAGEDDQAEAITAELDALATGPRGASVRDHLEAAARKEVLEVQWALEEVVEKATPKKAEPPPPPEPPKPQQPKAEDKPTKGGRLNPADLEMVYQDPRGLAIHRTKDGKRWFATQLDPYSGQPRTFELSEAEITQLKAQLGIFG